MPEAKDALVKILLLNLSVERYVVSLLQISLAWSNKWTLATHPNHQLAGLMLQTYEQLPILQWGIESDTFSRVDHCVVLDTDALPVAIDSVSSQLGDDNSLLAQIYCLVIVIVIPLSSSHCCERLGDCSIGVLPIIAC